MEERIEDKIVTIFTKHNNNQYGYGIQGTYKAVGDIIKICKDEFGVDNNELFDDNEKLVKTVESKNEEIKELEHYVQYIKLTLENSNVDFIGKTAILHKANELLKK